MRHKSGSCKMLRIAAMVDWGRFREAFAAGLPNAARLASLRKMNGWLDLTPADAAAALEAEIEKSDARFLYQNLIVLNMAIQREAGIPAGPESGPPLQKLFAECQQGTASDERRRIAARLSILYQLANTVV